ncbi:MAG TPA: hypothetical protein VMB75_01265, partial [Rhodocyclaceae bacterium]|nr:hypothetical protein [Rhodocyclaceae bacterium]
MDIEPELHSFQVEPFEAAIEGGDFALAARCCDEAEATPRFREDEAFRGAVLLARCRILRTTGDYAQALEAGVEAFRIFKMLGSAVNVARCHNRIGAVH